ncbi:MAG: GYD domain-containing protein [Planctomycetota bacterium]|nr:GYD domain-containing protein [Planctomycetota bacterium]MDA1142916.1 GYD domain-containing protein [Planctomycetota bacterium]
MPTYLSLIQFTEQGIQNIQASPGRARKFSKAVKASGGKVRQIYWTLGSFDGAVIFDAPDEETATALLLSLGGQGNVRTETLRAFHEKEFQGVLGKLN